MKSYLYLIFFINLSLLTHSLFSQTAAIQNEKGEFQMTVLLDGKNPIIKEYEIELAQEKEENKSEELRTLKTVKPGRIVLDVPNQFQYFRVRAVALLNIRGYWTEFHQIKRFPFSKNKQEVREVVVPQPITKPDLFFSLKSRNGQLEQYLAEPKLRLSSKDDTKSNQIFYRLQNSPWQSSENIVIDFPEDGNYELEYYSVDLVGNKEVSQFLQFTVDRTPPSTTARFSEINYVGNGQNYLPYRSELRLETYDAGSGTDSTLYRLVCDKSSPKDWIKYKSPIPLRDLGLEKCEEGVLEYYSQDQVGNPEIPNRILLNLKTESK
ncbi:hypothetical protein LPTSP3_g17090 [Leptospira kobayashii]|uniref:Lipoprotein n=1 Tax=Leptospira kobayashii TaxID=1917830 RepID=A0ABN6KFZ6_9LEPT|nr:hypothetical protein [Leptospira kobayashii]BDA78779.1 hypothetical protein LPTSP3_g17090 [Leptospira kobayashii]